MLFDVLDIIILAKKPLDLANNIELIATTGHRVKQIDGVMKPLKLKSSSKCTLITIYTCSRGCWLQACF